MGTESAVPATPRLVVGIDLGTTHTVVAWSDPAEPGTSPRVFDVPQLVTRGEIEARALLPSCLYAPLDGEVSVDPWEDAPFVVGELGRRRGGEVPGRLIASAKSWLSHGGVDREAPILPWGVDDEDVPHVSPVGASARVLAHVRRAWDAAFPGRPLAAQSVVLTVPASFDEVARELTVEAARRAGLSVRLLEEPQAAFYDFLRHAGRARLEPLLAGGEAEALVLVCDVGGGTTDLSLIEARRGEDGGVDLERIAVGSHLLLGGDNMDLALAHLAESRVLPASGDGPGARLEPRRFAQLVVACRAAKERLLGDDPPEDAPVAVAGSGSSLVGGTLSTRLGREETERMVLDGFLPVVARGARPERGRSALVAFGLPYERDVAITRHIAWFVARHAPGAAAPRAILLNGGVFRAKRIAERVAEAVTALGGAQGPPVDVLPHADPDLAVARGAVSYGLALQGHGRTIEGGAARGYYVGLDAADAGARRAVCVLPRGAREGRRYVAHGRTLALLVGRPVRFDLFASDDAAVDAPGDVVTVDEDRFQALPPIAAAIDARPASGQRAAGEVQVELEGELTPIGTLELACVEVAAAAPAEPRRFRLDFQLRPSPGGDATARASARPSPIAGRRFEDATAAIERVFGKKQQPEPREVKGLVRELERLLGDRASWTTQVNRGLYDALAPHARSRRRSAEHERVFWSLAGYCLRPGFGHPLDAGRIAALEPLFAERLAFAAEVRGWQQLWIAWRRVAGGLGEAAQLAIRDATDPFLAPSERKLKKPKGWPKPEALDLLLELSSSLERVPRERRAELGGWVLERTWTDRDPRLWAAIGRLGARVPAYASVHHVVPPLVAERWLDHLLREKWAEVPTAPLAAVHLARVTGDRARDVSERVRREVERRLAAAGAREEWVRAVRELVAASDEERADLFGEGLPVGLRLVD